MYKLAGVRVLMQGNAYGSRESTVLIQRMRERQWIETMGVQDHKHRVHSRAKDLLGGPEPISANQEEPKQDHESSQGCNHMLKKRFL